jgi:predicted RNase H-like HicB family nuclease
MDMLKDLVMRNVLLYPGEDGFWVAEVPSLPGCISQGETREAALANIKEAIEDYIEVLLEDGLPVPDEFPSPAELVVV